MSGNEYGERIHNFFGQEGLSQDQHQSQFVNGSWSSGFSNGLGGNQRQIDPSLVANLKSYSTQQCDDPERGQSSNSQHGFTQQHQPPVRPEYSRTLLQDNQQQLTNGYMHGQAMPNGSGFLGMDVTSSRDSLSAKGFSPNLQKSPMGLEMGESPVNYDFLGGQQQLNSQLPGMLQPFPRQQMTFNDMQLLKEQAMVKQMQQYQIQQQLQKQQLEARQLNSLNSNGVGGNRSSNYQSHPLSYGVPIQDVSSNNWQPDLMSGNAHWMHRSVSPVVHGLSSELMITPEHGQANLTQQFEPSLYGMPLGGVNASQNSFQMNRLPAQHASSLPSQSTSFVNQGDVQGGHMLARSPYQEKVLFSHTSVPDSNDRPNFGNFQQDDSRERNISVQEKFGQMESSGPSEKSFMKEPGNVTALQKSATLDPAEEKILFGSDDNLWNAFGSNTDTSFSGNLVSSSSDLLDGSPCMKLGSWSALMQSAVAETSSNDAAFGNMVQNLGVKASNVPSERLHSDSTRTSAQHVHANGGLEKPMAQRNHLAGNFFNSSSSVIDGQNNLCPAQKNEGIEDRFGIWKAASNPSLAAPPLEQKNHFTQNLQMPRASYGFDIANAGNSSSASRNIQQHLNNNSVEKAIPQVNSRDGSHILDSYATSNNAGEVMAETNEMRNSGKENSNDSSRLKFSQQSLTHGFKKDTQVNAPDLSMFPGGKETQAGQVGSRPSISRMFQYHPMGNISVSDELNGEKVYYLPPALKQVSVGNQGHFGQSKPLGQPRMNMQIDRGHVSLNDLNSRNEASKGMRSENLTNASASANRSVDLCNQSNQMKKSASRQPMLELLDKVDQSQEHSLETDISRISKATPSAENDGQFRHSQSSGSQGFSLQLAPPSQPAPSPDDVQFSMNSLQPLNSLPTAPREKGTSQSRFAPWASNQSFPQQSSHQGSISGIPVERNITFGSGEGEAPKMMTVKRVEEDSSAHLQKVASKGEQQSPSRSDGLSHKESANQILHFGKTVSQSFSNKNHSASGGADHQQISPQMAPSWYSQYGTFKNGPPVNDDTGRFTSLKIGEQSSKVGSLADGLHSVNSSKQFNMPGAETPSSESLAHGDTDKLVNVVKPKKRKTATSDLLSWKKQVMQGPLRLKTLSDAELGWVRATNRVAEKVEFESLLEDGAPIRSKRRLIYTRQLMQQLFVPPPARVISLLASSNYEFVAYTAARAALGDACSSTSTGSSEVFSSLNKSNPKTETISNDQYIYKTAEDFVCRSQKLETDFARLQNGSTIADLAVEVQDLDKFAVINRFAKFHPTSYSSMDRTVPSLRLNPQRYVTIAPMPQNIPDRVQCLSL